MPLSKLTGQFIPSIPTSSRYKLVSPTYINCFIVILAYNKTKSLSISSKYIWAVREPIWMQYSSVWLPLPTPTNFIFLAHTKWKHVVLLCTKSLNWLVTEQNLIRNHYSHNSTALILPQFLCSMAHLWPSNIETNLIKIFCYSLY